MTKQYANYIDEESLDFDDLDTPKRQSFNGSNGLYRAQEIVSPYPVERERRNFIERERYDSCFSSQKKYYKRDKDFTPEERSQILARVSEVGATKAADEFGTRRWVIMQWLDNLEKFGSFDHPRYSNSALNKNKKNKNKKRPFEKSEQTSFKLASPLTIAKNSQEPKMEQPKPKTLNEDTELVQAHEGNEKALLTVNAQETQLKTQNQTEAPNLKNFQFSFEKPKQETQKITVPDALDQAPENVHANTEHIEHNENKILKKSRDFSPEERTQILALADKIGAAKAAIQSNTTFNVIKYWRNCIANTKKIQVLEPEYQSSESLLTPLATENKNLKLKLADIERKIEETKEKIKKSQQF